MQYIIDRDIGFYEGMVEQHLRHFRNSVPEDEQKHHKLAASATLVVSVLKQYRDNLGG